MSQWVEISSVVGRVIIMLECLTNRVSIKLNILKQNTPIKPLIDNQKTTKIAKSS